MMEYWDANSLFTTAPSNVESKTYFKWRKPQENSFKINCDGAFCKSSGKAGIGLICRNSEGLFSKGWAEKVNVTSAFHAEILAVHKAVVLAEHWQCFPVVIEMDCKVLFDALIQKSFRCCPWLLHGLLAEIFELVNDRSSYSFSLIPREGNDAADLLAALASRELGPNGLIMESPPPLATIVLREATFVEDCSFDQHISEADREGVG
ncbi:uncharacterized protein LOC114726242 [Neltuma alba]|uniref:uncharacterized protein LOC114726242 n=1 Tax=Neltuma alba TaxID=207710 RepID=UPI0010A3891C|nr:uncharacterized protein LOC114726242 [Prosopis alba]